MQLSIRWKLILSIVLPLMVLSVIVFSFTISRIYSFSKERLHEQATEQAQNYAARLDGQFQSFAQVARSTAEFLTIQTDISGQQIYALLSANITQNPMIYGSAIAFEPYQFDADLKLFSPYVYRSASGIKSIDIAVESYDYSSGDWEWYTRPKNAGQAVWTEPYFDEGAGNILMVTYSVPFYKNGTFRGIATIDIPLEKLQQQIGIEQLQDQPFIIVSPSGKFVAHPEPTLIMKSTIQEWAANFKDSTAETISRNILNGDTGVGILHKVDLMGMQVEGPVWIFFAPIQSTGWSFVTAVPESVMTDYIRTQLARGVFGIIVMVSLVTICILLVGTHLTRPIRRLASAVAQLGQGNLDTKISDTHLTDEIGQLANGFNCMVEELNEHIQALTREVAARELVETELRVAREIQTSLLPRTFPPFPDRNEFELHAVNKAARQVTGDFFDFFFINDDALMLVIADVSGKGIPAALMMAVTRTIIRNLAKTSESPAQILTETNHLLIEGRTQTMFVTIFIGCYFTDSGKFIYTNAGHHPPVRIDRNGNVTKFENATGTIVGMLDEATYENHEIALINGEYLVLYTDGIPEARSPTGQFYGEERFTRLLSKLFDKSTTQLCNSVIEDVADFQGGELADDITLLVLKRNPLPTQIQ